MADTSISWSGEDIAKLEKLISRVDDLTARQEEIITKVLAGEEEIGKLRISYLKQYFDDYSAGLDSIIARKTSKLKDAFLIAERQAEETAASSGSKRKHKKASSSDEKHEGTSKPSKATSDGGSGGGSNNSRSGGRLPPDSGKDVTVQQKITDDVRSKLESEKDSDESESDTKKKLDQWAKFFQKTEEERKNAILDGEADLDFNLKTIMSRRRESEIDQLKRQAETAKDIEDSMMELEILRLQSVKGSAEGAIERENQISEVRLAHMQEALGAEIEAQTLLNRYNAEIAYSEKHSEEAGETRARGSNAEDTEKTLQQLEENRLKFIAKKELEAKRKNNGVLDKEEAAKIQKLAAEKFKLDEKNLEKINKRRVELEAAKAHAAERAEMRGEINTLRTAETFEERKQALYNLTHDESGDVDVGKAMSAAMVAVSDLAKQLESKIDEIGSHKGLVDTRLQGSSNKKFMGSYWDQLTRDMTSVGAVNPFFKQETFAANIDKLVEKGIAFDLKQRAFLMTIQEKIANTFDVADGTLLRLIRIQQEDSTAGRLGMESALNSFLNEMYETSEYLSDVASSVRGSLQEMEALMKGAEATEVEYQVQKWLGSLYSVGMSQDAVNKISTALGQIAAGQIEGLTSGGAGNLLIMAANDAGLSIADILTDGINSSDTNKLLQAAVNYLAELSDSAKDNKVVQQQLADVFGVKASDLRAATNLVLPGTTNAIYSEFMDYEGMLGQLSKMAGSMINRTSVAEMMTNFWENGQYTLAGSMASNPISYFIYKMAKVVDDAAGGIDLPFLNVMGFGVDLNTTVSDLMRLAAVGGGILGSIGPMISGLGSSFSGRAMLDKLGIGTGSGLAVTPRGSGGLVDTAGGGAQSTSASGYVGNSSGSDIKDSTIQESEDSKKQQMIEAKEEEEPNQVNVLNTTVLKIYELLDDVAHGSGCFKVKVESYGLTNGGSSGSSSGALAGVAGLERNSGGAGPGGGAGVSSTGSATSSGVNSSIDLGGWVMI